MKCQLTNNKSAFRFTICLCTRKSNNDVCKFDHGLIPHFAMLINFLALLC